MKNTTIPYYDSEYEGTEEERLHGLVDEILEAWDDEQSEFKKINRQNVKEKRELKKTIKEQQTEINTLKESGTALMEVIKQQSQQIEALRQELAEKMKAAVVIQAKVSL